MWAPGLSVSIAGSQQLSLLILPQSGGGVGVMITLFISEAVFSVMAALGGEGSDYLFSIC